MPRSKRGRLRQLENWLGARFPQPRRTTITVCKLANDLGDTNRHGNEIRIRLNSKLTWEVSVHFLFHEWAHAMTWPLASVEDYVEEHSAEWGVAHAAILREFFDNEGWMESQDYPEE